MSLQDQVEELERQLVKVGLNFAAPHPQLAWQGFKEFALLPICDLEVKAEPMGVSVAFAHYADRDDELWLEFSRDVHLVAPDGELLATTSIGCHLTHRVPQELIGIDKVLPATGSNTLQEYFNAVEGHPTFQLCLRLPDWKWERTHWHWENENENRRFG